jgi:hypothetical protein
MGPIGSIFTPLASIATIDKEPQKEKKEKKGKDRDRKLLLMVDKSL